LPFQVQGLEQLFFQSLPVLVQGVKYNTYDPIRGYICGMEGLQISHSID